MTSRSVQDLRPHPENQRIYGDRADAELVESIRTKGVLNPLLITSDGLIISGHRRFDAALRCDLPDVPVSVFSSDDELDILEAVIESNLQREKSNEQRGREYKTLKWIYHERSKQGQRSDLSRFDSPTSGKHLPEVDDIQRKPNQRAAKEVGLSRPTADKAIAVVDVIDQLEDDGKDREAAQLRAALNDDGVSRAHNKAKEAGYIASDPKPEPKANTEPIMLAEWRQMDEGQQWSALNRPRSKTSKFNWQKDDNIEWALWSWNPITGCLHNCTYCYARDIAERFYAQGFVPAFLPERLDAPRNTRIPPEAARNIGHKNVFTCSMADLFGKWVPVEWIEAVLDAARTNPQWNFLFLTKFPKRLAEFNFPENAWVGTSVDAQARIPVAEAAMRNVNARVKWYSCEPMLEPLHFTDLSLVDWVVIGGASASTQTPAFRPPRAWVEDLERQAHAAGCRVYEKTNLLERIREYPGQLEHDALNVPDAFKLKYLQRDMVEPQAYEQEVSPQEA